MDTAQQMPLTQHLHWTQALQTAHHSQGGLHFHSVKTTALEVRSKRYLCHFEMIFIPVQAFGIVGGGAALKRKDGENEK